MRSVSVIVTAFNVEKFIDNTVLSILSQTMADLEIIVVDDGSTDGTSRILDSLCATDVRIKLIRRENGGVSTARNDGLMAATGEYVLYVDGDDLLMPAACESLYHKAMQTDADIVVSDYSARNEAGGGDAPRSGGAFTSLTGKEFGRLLLQPFFSVAIWNKLVRRSLYDDHGIRFPADISLAEDMLTLLELSCHAHRVVKLDEPTLIYIQRTGSLVGTVSPKHFTVSAAMDRVGLLLDEHYESSSEMREEYHLACYYTVLYTRVIHCHTYNNVHRDLYNWYKDKRFTGGGERLSGFIVQLPIRERFIAFGYQRSYHTGIYMSRITDLARMFRSLFRRR